LSKSAPNTAEVHELTKALESVVKPVNIRLREGEYQFSLAKAIASFEFELRFPDAKDLAKKLYGEKSIEDQQFLNKIQTILKKMEKSGVIKILPKEKPWELQRYALTSFKFLDVEKNSVSFATKDEIKKTRQTINSRPESEHATIQRPKNMNLQLSLLIAMIVVSLSLTIWTVTQSPINLAIFVAAFFLAAVSSTILGVLIAKKQ
jgi:hypothetical protein